MNPILILTHDNLEYTKRCVESVLTQDIPTSIVLFDNGSKDGTVEWAKTELPKGTLIIQVPENLGVSYGWNAGLDLLFKDNGAEHVLVLGNDTVIPKSFYSSLLSYNLPFVTGVAVDNMEQLNALSERSEPVPYPDFSAFLTKREVWEKVGSFSSDLVSWCSDCDFHVRAFRLGIQLWKVNERFFHVRSRTIELANPREKRTLELQADVDRMTFASIWKAEVGSPQYAELFSEDAFGIDLD
jgi:GT2 family glycosyltransferase